MPACNLCGYAVEWVRSCFRSQWRLFRNTQGPTPGRYYFSPPGTPFYPGPHNYWSRDWVSDELDPPPPLGEVPDAKRTYDLGTPPGLLPLGHLLGSAECVRDGDVYPAHVPGRTITDGYDSRCPVAEVS